MALHFFTPKTTCALLSVGGFLGGGGALYYYRLPSNWRELFERDGITTLTQDNEYKAIYNDHKDESVWTEASDLNGASSDNAHTKLKTYCEKELASPLPLWNLISPKKNTLITLCTQDGIKTTKARLIVEGNNSWLSDGESDNDKYKTVFAIYRYNEDFRNWVKKHDPNKGELTQESDVDTNFSKLKTACSTVLLKPHKDTKDKEFSYVTWWCRDPSYSTIKERIKHAEPTWEQETDGDTIKNKWKDTEDVVNTIKTDLSKNDDIEGTDYKSWCEDQLTKKVNSDNNYQSKYLKIRSVCRKNTSSAS